MFLVFFLTLETPSPAAGNSETLSGDPDSHGKFGKVQRRLSCAHKAAAGMGTASKLTPRTVSQDLVMFSGT